MTGLASLWRQCREWDRRHDAMYCDPTKAPWSPLRSQPRRDVEVAR